MAVSLPHFFVFFNVVHVWPPSALGSGVSWGWGEKQGCAFVWRCVTNGYPDVLSSFIYIHNPAWNVDYLFIPGWSPPGLPGNCCCEFSFGGCTSWDRGGLVSSEVFFMAFFDFYSEERKGWTGKKVEGCFAAYITISKEGNVEWREKCWCPQVWLR